MPGPFNGADGGNPFVSGIVNAVNIAGAIKQQALAQQNQALAQAREGRAAQEETRQQQSSDLDMQQRLMGGGNRIATNQDLIDQKTGALPNQIQKFGQNQWVMATPAQRDEYQARQNQTKVAQEGAVEGAKEGAKETAKNTADANAKKAAQQALKDEVTTNGTQISDEDADFLHWPKGTKIINTPEHLAEFSKHLNDAKEAQAKADTAKAAIANKSYAAIKEVQTDDSGKSTAVWDDGSTSPLGKIGKSKTVPREPGDTPSQKRTAAKDDLNNQINEAGSRILNEPGVTDFKTAAAKVAEIGKKEPFYKQNTLRILQKLQTVDKQYKPAGDDGLEQMKAYLAGGPLPGDPAGTPPKTNAPSATAPAKKPYVAQGPPASMAGPAISVTLPNGKFKNFPDRKSADAFKAAAGIK